jgi:hypothetical protein
MPFSHCASRLRAILRGQDPAANGDGRVSMVGPHGMPDRDDGDPDSYDSYETGRALPVKSRAAFARTRGDATAFDASGLRTPAVTPSP